ncbi:UDP-N-acetylmuramoyl-L-alanyl-D-glutamate--2,6-diaminopimelate ligase [Shouchella lonarensis]|uniref:UDP-N-acetylmuramoyl-L-alanyl-D-glutamate--2,6-diaminopimelate ligase n=1 Tax=Shouchella lonarensis TaxID=1464122 RepID=A0A1G6KW90_9BACI|nr:UDP-N-acetylmuramoyl-L-alanyl-D-glutamate--2,6-diaminopimelate ligase [Shouchella lonarensis]SDC35051.1 UDP-N-acetylmuramoylalanyl-D-glutamate--2,6-diaminopimelate ligase [Shouchella lonarensis]
MTLQQLLRVLREVYDLDPEAQNIHVTRLDMDSRSVREGTLFFCIKGYTVDGHDYAAQAVANGAVAIVSERPLSLSVPVVVVRDTKRAMARLASHFYNEPTKHLHLIGVTGTNGKTSVSHMLAQLFEDAGKPSGLIGTLYTKIGKETLETANTTPESLILQKRFSTMLERNIETAVMEVSSHALDLGRVHGCDFDVAVFTNLTRDHLDYHETMEQYLFAKGLLFSQLGNTYNGKVAVINIDDPAAHQLMKMTAVDVVTYGIDAPAHVTAEEIQVTASGTTFLLCAFGEKVAITLPLIGRFNVYNALATTAAALASGLSLVQIKQSLPRVSGVAGRFERIDEGQDFTVIVDYAHTPDSLKNVLMTVQQLTKQAVTVVIGCGGDRDVTKRPIMGKIATGYATRAIFTSDNPRTEAPEKILDQIVQGASDSDDTYEVVIDRRMAIRHAISQAKKGDVIVIAGKGHETYQEIGHERMYFDDRLEAREAIKEYLK